MCHPATRTFRSTPEGAEVKDLAQGRRFHVALAFVEIWLFSRQALIFTPNPQAQQKERSHEGINLGHRIVAGKGGLEVTDSGCQYKKPSAQRGITF